MYSGRYMLSICYCGTERSQHVDAGATVHVYLDLARQRAELRIKADDRYNQYTQLYSR